MNYCLITGASAGIGAAFAEEFASHGYNLVLVARRKEKLEELASKVSKQHGVQCAVIAADLSDPAAPAAIFEKTQKDGLVVECLINNAGYASNEAFAALDFKEHAGAIQVMVTALTELCHLYLPGMKANGRGYIINLSSIAAHLPPMAGSLYTAIKSYVRDFSLALDMETKPAGINSTVLCPGFTRSEFHDVMETREAMNRMPDFVWQEADEVAKEGFAAVMKGEPEVINGNVNKLMAGAAKLVPDSIKLWASRSTDLFS